MYIPFVSLDDLNVASFNVNNTNGIFLLKSAYI